MQKLVAGAYGNSVYLCDTDFGDRQTAPSYMWKEPESMVSARDFAIKDIQEEGTHRQWWGAVASDYASECEEPWISLCSSANAIVQVP